MRRWTVAAGMWIAIASSAVAAPPQALLVATPGEVSLPCEFGRCAADLGTICLQPELASPIKGTRYAVLDTAEDATAVAFVAVARDGTETDIPATKFTFASERGHLAIKVAALESEVGGSDVVAVKLRVTRPFVLAPDPLPADLDKVAATLRPIAETILNNRATELTAAAILRDVLQGLPGPNRPSTGPERDRAWQKALDTRPGGNTGAVERARNGFDHCAEWEKFRPVFGFCLRQIHDGILEDINEDFRTSLDYGS